ncbi:MAG: hypothetical protein U0736_21640 [Gemmataceae bacterium]
MATFERDQPQPPPAAAAEGGPTGAERDPLLLDIEVPTGRTSTSMAFLFDQERERHLVAAVELGQPGEQGLAGIARPGDQRASPCCARVSALPWWTW